MAPQVQVLAVFAEFDSWSPLWKKADSGKLFSDLMCACLGMSRPQLMNTHTHTMRGELNECVVRKVLRMVVRKDWCQIPSTQANSAA